MAKKIQAWVEFGPRVQLSDPMTPREIIESLVNATNQSRGSVLALLSELDVLIEAGLKAGRIVQLPNGTHFEPVGKKDGSVIVAVRVNPEVTRRVNNEFHGKWLRPENRGITEAEVIELWNQAHPDDPLEA
jgi:hypothetical protein